MIALTRKSFCPAFETIWVNTMRSSLVNEIGAVFMAVDVSIIYDSIWNNL